MAKGTRHRIMDTARALFNEKGYGAVTNEVLSEALGIATGNIWYHFHTQRDLLDALSEEFLNDINERLMIRPSEDGDVIEEYAALLVSMAAEFRRHRFLYRDQTDFGEFTETLKTAIPDLFNRTIEQFVAFYRAMIANGLFVWEEDTLRDLTAAVVILLRYSLEYRREMDLLDNRAEGAVREGISLHLSLIEHRLVPEAAAYLRAALNAA
ncbi:MAG: TetR/AcrR family transcriptional regulator [Pseudomonadota bacterium]